MKYVVSDPLKVYSARKLALENALDDMAVIDCEAWEGLDGEGMLFGVVPIVNRCRIDGLAYITKQYFKLNLGDFCPTEIADEICLYSADACVCLALIAISKMQTSKLPSFSQLHAIRHNLESALGFINELVKPEKKSSTNRKLVGVNGRLSKT